MQNLNKYNDLVSRLCYQLEVKLPEKGVIDNETLKNIIEENNPEKVGKRFKNLKKDHKFDNIELVGSIYDHNTLYIAVKIHDPSTPEIDNKVIIGCTGTNDSLIYPKITNGSILLPTLGPDWKNNVNGIGFQSPCYGSDDGNSAFYKEVVNWINAQQNQNDVISITGHSRGGFLAQILGTTTNIPNITGFNSAPVLFPNDAYNNYNGNLSLITIEGDPLDLATNNNYKWYNGFSTSLGTGEGDHIYNNKDKTEINDIWHFCGITSIIEQLGWTIIGKLDTLGMIDFDNVSNNSNEYYIEWASLQPNNLFSNSYLAIPTTDIDLNPDNLRYLSANINKMYNQDFAFISSLLKECLIKNQNIEISQPIRKDELTNGILQAFDDAFIFELLRKLTNQKLQSFAALYMNEEFFNYVYDCRNAFRAISKANGNELTNAHDLNITHYSKTKISVNGIERNKDDVFNLLKKYDVSLKTYATPYSCYTCEDDEVVRTCNTLFQKASDMLNKVETLNLKLNTNSTGIGTLRQEIESNIDKVFQGEGLRSEFRDGIAQSISEIVSYEMNNTNLGIAKLQELEKNINACADNNETLDKLGSHNHNANYETNILSDVNIRLQLESSNILNDVDSMQGARQQQIDDRSQQLATFLNRFLSSSVDDIKNFTASNYNGIFPLEQTYYGLLNKNEVDFDITVCGDCNITIVEEQYKNFFMSEGSMTSSSENNIKIRKPVNYVQQTILETIDKFPTNLDADYYNESLQRYFNNIQSYLCIIPSGDELKNIIQHFVENGIYRSMDLESVVSSHIYIADYLKTIHKELMYVREVLSGYSGETIAALVANITDVLTDIELMNYASKTAFGLE